jgi:hypothetical protein
MIDPADGPGRRDTICAFAVEDSPERREWRARSEDYVAPEWTPFFASIDDSVINLKHRVQLELASRFGLVALEPDSKITFLDLRPWRGVA